jgi:hypothetical protein
MDHYVVVVIRFLHSWIVKSTDKSAMCRSAIVPSMYPVPYIRRGMSACDSLDVRAGNTRVKVMEFWYE